ncbi:hypothetical protein HPB52_010964 [Rhipicephalus sanguineus]|uniref:Uncharacterized protein n=1 Tax=Rhipicephalus sanguineus TaxID=34632 RepID=A0A9D4PZG2_RHISA|nr:hypothetical protein HPB52_010964 [Rhipicephalus sanguineus]
MLIFRGAVMQHPRGSTSAPAMSPHYWIPPTSVSCTGVTEVHYLLAPFSAAIAPRQRCLGVAPPVSHRDTETGMDKAEGNATIVFVPSEHLGISLATEPSAKRSWKTGIAFFLSALLAFGGSLVVMLVVGQLVQPRKHVVEEHLVGLLPQQLLVPGAIFRTLV